MNLYHVTVRRHGDGPTAPGAFAGFSADCEIELVECDEEKCFYEIQTECNLSLLLDQAPGVVVYEETLNYDPL